MTNKKHHVVGAAKVVEYLEVLLRRCSDVRIWFRSRCCSPLEARELHPVPVDLDLLLLRDLVVEPELPATGARDFAERRR